MRRSCRLPERRRVFGAQNGIGTTLHLVIREAETWSNMAQPTDWWRNHPISDRCGRLHRHRDPMESLSTGGYSISGPGRFACRAHFLISHLPAGLIDALANLLLGRGSSLPGSSPSQPVGGRSAPPLSDSALAVSNPTKDRARRNHVINMAAPAGAGSDGTLKGSSGLCQKREGRFSSSPIAAMIGQISRCCARFS